MSEFRLTPEQRHDLRGWLGYCPDASASRRALALLALDEGHSATQAAELLGVSRQSVYNWAQAYRRHGEPEALLARYGVGRPTAWTEDMRRLLRDCLRRRPHRLGYPGVNWTVPLLREHLRLHGGRDLSDDTVRRELRRLGYVWKRYRYVLPPDTEREKKKPHSPPAAATAAPRRRAG